MPIPTESITKELQEQVRALDQLLNRAAMVICTGFSMGLMPYLADARIIVDRMQYLLDLDYAQKAKGVSDARTD